jgi:multisubunit Na+/H+ antiporter MnhE subunit
VLVAVVVGFAVSYSDESPTTAIVAIVATAIVVPLAFYPFSKTLWSAIDLAMRPLEPEDDVDPRWIPPATRHEA